MSLRQLKVIAVVAPLVFLTAVELLRQTLSPDLFQAWPGYLLLGGIVLAGTLSFAEMIFGVMARLQRRLALQNQELLALNEAGLAIVGELELQTVLQLVVDRARELVGARYGALSYLHDTGGTPAFLTSGITADERKAIGAPPQGYGLLGVVLEDGEHLRISDLGRDPRSVGFPVNHPPMGSLLAVPIRSHGSILGNLYLTEKDEATTFSADDEEMLDRFATHAALAIENARLHRQVRALATTEERERIAREMHDSLAQVLGYVNTKAQAVELLVQSGQTDRALTQIGQLAEAARSAYADVREGILGLRTSLDANRNFLDTLRDYLVRWQLQSGVTAHLVADTVVNHRLSLSPIGEVQLLRIIQEALNNVRKHASASRVEIRLAECNGWIDIVVEDDGQGFVPEDLGRSRVPRFGLTTMRERAEAIRGTFAVTASPDHGTRVAIRIPVEQLTGTVEG